MSLAVATHDAAALARLKPEIERNADNAAIYMAAGYALIHNADSTLAWPDRSYALRSDVLGFVQLPMFDCLRNDPRFIAFRHKNQIAPLQR